MKNTPCAIPALAIIGRINANATGCILITSEITIPDTNPIIPAIILKNTILQTYTSNGIGIIACLRVFSRLDSFGYRN